MAIGDEKDISEYNQVLITRIQDAFNWKKSQQEEHKVQNQPVSATAVNPVATSMN